MELCFYVNDFNDIFITTEKRNDKLLIILISDKDLSNYRRLFNCYNNYSYNNKLISEIDLHIFGDELFVEKILKDNKINNIKINKRTFLTELLYKIQLRKFKYLIMGYYGGRINHFNIIIDDIIMNFKMPIFFTNVDNVEHEQLRNNVKTFIENRLQYKKPLFNSLKESIYLKDIIQNPNLFNSLMKIIDKNCQDNILNNFTINKILTKIIFSKNRNLTLFNEIINNYTENDNNIYDYMKEIITQIFNKKIYIIEIPVLTDALCLNDFNIVKIYTKISLLDNNIYIVKYLFNSDINIDNFDKNAKIYNYYC